MKFDNRITVCYDYNMIITGCINCRHLQIIKSEDKCKCKFIKQHFNIQSMEFKDHFNRKYIDYDQKYIHDDCPFPDFKETYIFKFKMKLIDVLVNIQRNIIRSIK